MNLGRHVSLSCYARVSITIILTLVKFVVVQAVAVGGEFVEGVVGSEQTGRSKQQLELLSCSNLGFICM